MNRLKKMKVLLVDDDEAIRISMEYFFRNKTSSFRSFESAEDAMAFIDEDGPCHIVIADYRLPLMDGVSFLKTIKEKWPGVLTLMISAYSDPELLASARELEINKVVQKPFKAGTILEALTRLARLSVK